MSIRDVTFEELLAILRGPHELAAKTAAENPDRYSFSLGWFRGPATEKSKPVFVRSAARAANLS